MKGGQSLCFLPKPNKLPPVVVVGHFLLFSHQGETGAVVGRTMAPKDVHTLSPRTCGYGPLHGKRNFTDEVKLRILQWEDFPGLLKGPNAITRDQEGGNHDRRCDDPSRDLGKKGAKLCCWL